MSVDAPAPVSFSPLRRIVDDVIAERRARHFPPGPTSFSLARTTRIAREPLDLLLELYAEHGPIFSLRALHSRIVFMLGPEANHFVLVAHPELFHWRESSFGDLIPLLGDGLLTIDGRYHDRSRAIMLPAFHHEQIALAARTMSEEAERALAPWRAGETVDLYGWMRRLAMRIAMRALLGLDPDDHGSGVAAAEHFERALSYYGGEYHWRLLRGPGSPWRRMLRSRAVLDEIVFAEIARRRAGANGDADAGAGEGILGMLLAARDEDGSGLDDRQVRDQAMTLLFAGHDTSTSTLAFLVYELARNPEALARVSAELDRVLGGRPPTAAELARELPELEMALEETLRLYPPAWIGPRRAVADFEFAGHRVSAGAYVNYCSWASHRLPDVWPEPDRFAREAKAKLPRGAYVPFGGGSRICIGRRFGELEVKAVATAILQRFRPEVAPGYELSIREMPTLSPAAGMPIVLRPR